MYRPQIVPKGIRTPVTAVKGRCPEPLDDGDLCLFYLYSCLIALYVALPILTIAFYYAR